VIELPWPPSQLSPNSRKDRRWATKYRQSYRDAGFYAAHQSGDTVPADAHLVITFHPPDKRRRDLDNMLGSIKYGLDGIALAAGVDDYGWSMTIIRADPVACGRVLIEIKQPPAVGAGG